MTRLRFTKFMAATVGLVSIGAAPAGDVGPLVRALWLCQDRGTADASDPKNDQRLKGTLAKAMAKDGSFKGVPGFMSTDTFAKLAGADGRIDVEEATRAIEADRPASRDRLNPGLVAHADYLSTTFDQIDETHREASTRLAEWIASHYEKGKPLHVVCVCTGNTRRSFLGAAMGNVASAYYGMAEVRFSSGGTAPSAFNPRTITALRAIGVEIEPTGKEAPRGEPATANPIYRVRWGEGDLMAEEFSKKFSDPSQPKEGFAALMVCSEADAACPHVPGASLRLSVPYLDPKIYDSSSYETAKYAERRDDMGRFLMSALMQARRKLRAD